MEQRTLKFIKNHALIHTFENISGEVMPFICFGEGNQHYSVSMN